MWKYIASVFLLLLLICNYTFAQTGNIESSANDRYKVQGIEYKSGYETVPQFGGPGSVGSILREDNELKYPLLRLKVLDDLFKPRFKFKNKVKESTGISFGTDEPHPKAVPRKLEISGFFKCFFAYSSGAILSIAQKYFIENINNL